MPFVFLNYFQLGWFPLLVLVPEHIACVLAPRAGAPTASRCAGAGWWPPAPHPGLMWSSVRTACRNRWAVCRADLRDMTMRDRVIFAGSFVAAVVLFIFLHEALVGLQANHGFHAAVHIDTSENGNNRVMVHIACLAYRCGPLNLNHLVMEEVMARHITHIDYFQIEGAQLTLESIEEFAFDSINVVSWVLDTVRYLMRGFYLRNLPCSIVHGTALQPAVHWCLILTVVCAPLQGTSGEDRREIKYHMQSLGYECQHIPHRLYWSTHALLLDENGNYGGGYSTSKGISKSSLKKLRFRQQLGQFNGNPPFRVDLSCIQVEVRCARRPINCSFHARACGPWVASWTQF